MARLIDADALMDKLRRMPIFEKTDFDKKMLYVEKSIIDDMPTVDVNNFGCKWIPVTERLPEDDLPKGSKVKQIKVLTALKANSGARTVRSQMRFRCTWYTDSAPWTWKCSGGEVTHWMPLPEPPKEVE